MLGTGSYQGQLARLGKHTTGKGCLYIKRLADVDQKALADLIAQCVAAMRANYPDQKSPNE